MLVATVWGYSQLDAVVSGLIVIAAALYILGVQVPTALINVPGRATCFGPFKARLFGLR